MSIAEKFLTEDAERTAEQLRYTGAADLVIGIPSLKEADNIAFVAEQVDEGARKYFPDARTVIVNVDNNSPDGTREAFSAARMVCPSIYLSTPEGMLGKGNNFYNLFRAAEVLNAKAVVAVDADLRSVSPEWVYRIATPVLEHGCDYVAPYYSRNEYDGTITNHLCYPLLHGLLGNDVRQPIGGDFGLSAKLVHHALEQDWQQSTREYGVDIFLTMNALLGDFAICQTGLGAKIHKPSAPKLGPMFLQVVTTLFNYLCDSMDTWRERKVLEDPRSFGDLTLGEPQGLAVDYKAIKRQAMAEYQERRDRIKDSLHPETFSILDPMMKHDRILIDTRCWTYVLYDMLHAFDRSGRDPEVVAGLRPLFFSRVASFIRDTIDLTSPESEAMIVNQAKEFRRSRDYLLDQYDGTPRQAE